MQVQEKVTGTVAVFTDITGESGAGFGNILNLLSLQPEGSTTFESGSVLWDGSQDILLGDAKSTSQTQTASTLLANDIIAGAFALVFNINEASEKTVTLPACAPARPRRRRTRG